MKLNLGCGSRVLDEWINVDYALGARLAKFRVFRSINAQLRLFTLDWDPRIVIHDLSKTFPWVDGSAAMIYSSHTLEHFSREVGRRFLRECHRVLRPGALIRLVVPDLEVLVSDYTSGRVRADDFVDTLHVTCPEARSTFRRLLMPIVSYPHRCMYDTPTLLRVLEEEGFVAKARLPFDSAIPDIRAIEIAERTQAAVIVEGTRS